MGGPSRAPGVPSQRFNQNHMASVGRPHPLEAIFKKRRKVIKTILRNQQFSVKTCKNDKFGVFEGQWVPVE